MAFRYISLEVTDDAAGEREDDVAGGWTADGGGGWRILMWQLTFLELEDSSNLHFA
jgi:hypothetical protein